MGDDRPPSPLGFIALDCSSRREGRTTLLAEGRPAVLTPAVGRFRTALGSHPCFALSSAGTDGALRLRGGEVFPVSVTLGVPGVGNGESGCRSAGIKAETELVAAGLADNQTLAGEFGQGVAQRGGAHSAELAQLLNRDGPILTGQSVPDAVRRRGGS